MGSSYWYLNLTPVIFIKWDWKNKLLFVSLLLLLQKYQEHMYNKEKDGSELAGTITLLCHTSKLIELFNDKLPITCTTDQVVSYAECGTISKFQNIFPTISWGGICFKLQIHLISGRKGLLSKETYIQNHQDRRFTKKGY